MSYVWSSVFWKKDGSREFKLVNFTLVPNFPPSIPILRRCVRKHVFPYQIDEFRVFESEADVQRFAIRTMQNAIVRFLQQVFEKTLLFAVEKVRILTNDATNDECLIYGKEEVVSLQASTNSTAIILPHAPKNMLCYFSVFHNSWQFHPGRNKEQGTFSQQWRIV